MDHPEHMNHQPPQVDSLDMQANGHLSSNSVGTMMDEVSGGDMPHQHMHHHQMADDMSMMKMYFHYGLGDMVLFRGLFVDSNTKLMLTCFVLFLSGILLELIDYSRGYLSCRCRAMAELIGQHKSSSASESSLVDSQVNSNGAAGVGQGQQNWSCCVGSGVTNPGRQPIRAAVELRSPKGLRSKAQFFPVRSPDPHSYRLLQAGLQFIRTGLSLTLMLVAMTYNICLIFPILLGSAVGFYIFYRPALDSKSVVCH